MDDFNRAGNMDCPEWLEIRKKIDQAYAWGTVKRQSYRHTGIDLEVCEKGDESWVQLCQDYYTDGIPDLCVPAERLRGDPNKELMPPTRSQLAELLLVRRNGLQHKLRCKSVPELTSCSPAHRDQDDPSCQGDSGLDQRGSQQPGHPEALAYARGPTLARRCDCHLGRSSPQQPTSRWIYW